MRYRLVKIDQFTSDPALKELIEIVGMNRINPQAAQAAAWHIANKMSWQELASKKRIKFGSRPTLYFSDSELFGAQSLVSVAVARVHEKARQQKDQEEPTEPEPVRKRTRR
jgi:hypothetical protein